MDETEKAGSCSSSSPRRQEIIGLLERVRHRSPNQKISKSENAEAGNKHHKPKSKLSTRFRGP